MRWRTGFKVAGPLVEDGLRAVLASPPVENRYTLPDLRVGDPNDPDPLEQYSWPELRELIHGDRGTG
ncbi:MAG: hypothetical protein OXM56_12030 [Gammaproteobacteria bacterium]|nr:hypothetical protein [Gammaproteobacteria bacterium]